MFGWFASRRRVDDLERELADLRVKVVAGASQASVEKLQGELVGLAASEDVRAVGREIDPILTRLAALEGVNIDKRLGDMNDRFNALHEQHTELAGRVVRAEELLAENSQAIVTGVADLGQRIDLLSGDKVEVEVEVEGEAAEALEAGVTDPGGRLESILEQPQPNGEASE